MRTRRRLAVPALASTALAASLALATAPISAAEDTAPDPGTTSTEDAGSPAEADSNLVIDSRPRTQASLNRRGRVRWLDLGFSVTAPGESVSVWSTRQTYADPIRSEVRIGDTAVPLPDSMDQRFDRLAKFLTVKITKDGKRRPAAVLTRGMCLNSWSSTRIRPDAPARNPYPYGCGAMPYTLGTVMGVQAGHSAMPRLSLGRLSLDPGRYTAVISVNRAWRDVIGMTDEDATTSTRIRIRPSRGRRGPVYYYGEYGRDGDAVPTTTNDEPQAAAEAPPEGTPVPDLRATPAWGININRRGTALRFGATVWNGGESPLVIDGFRDDDDHDHMTTYQYFFDGRGDQVGYQQVGEMHWHAANHQHWHLDDFARYTLLDSDMKTVVKSSKRSFCLANTDAIDYTVAGANWRPDGTDLSTACGDRSALAVREVLDSGSGDTYHQYRAGQAFRIGDLPNGTYYIATIANPLGNLLESDTSNNVALRKIKLEIRGGKRRVVVPKVGLVNERERFRNSGWW